jgi:chromate reductase, NAD(P)H dehydrogenase (quinone)
MANLPRILAFSGSARRDSLNKKLLAVAVTAVREAGGEVTLIDLNDYVLPLYHGDLETEQGLPDNAKKLIQLGVQHNALLIASPEYNGFITPLLKNTIDWMTRDETDPFEGKVAAVVSASPGPFGGLRSQLLAQQLLAKIGCHIVPLLCVLPRAHQAFDEQGRLKDAQTQKSVHALATDLVRTAGRLSA